MRNTYLNNLNHETVRKTAGKNRIRLLAVLLLFALMIFTIILATKKANAKREGNRIKQVTSVEIHKGDTLWSIASRYMSDEYDNLNEYIEEIKMSNGMTSDEIYAGSYIIVPYYTDGPGY